MSYFFPLFGNGYWMLIHCTHTKIIKKISLIRIWMYKTSFYTDKIAYWWFNKKWDVELSMEVFMEGPQPLRQACKSRIDVWVSEGTIIYDIIKLVGGEKEGTFQTHPQLNYSTTVWAKSSRLNIEEQRTHVTSTRREEE